MYYTYEMSTGNERTALERSIVVVQSQEVKRVTEAERSVMSSEKLLVTGF